MRTLLRQGLGRKIGMLLLAAVLLGTVASYALSAGIEWSLHRVVADLAGAPGEFDAIIHLRSDAGEDTIRRMQDRLDQSLPGLTWRRAPDVAGHVNVLLGFGNGMRNARGISTLDAVLEDVPGVEGTTFILDPSIVVTDVPPSIRGQLAEEARRLADVDFVFQRDDAVWIVLRSVGAIPLVEAYLEEWTERFLVVDLVAGDAGETSSDVHWAESYQVLLADYFRDATVQAVSDNAHVEHTDAPQENAGIDASAPTWSWATLWEIIVDFVETVLARWSDDAAPKVTGEYVAGDRDDRNGIDADIIALLQQLVADYPGLSPDLRGGLVDVVQQIELGDKSRRRAVYVIEGPPGVSMRIDGGLDDVIPSDVSWYGRPGGRVQLDARTTVMLLVAQARRAIAFVAAAMLVVLFYIVDLSLIVSFCRRLAKQSGGPASGRWSASALGGIGAAVLFVGMYWGGTGLFMGQVPPVSTIGWAAGTGFLLGVALSTVSEGFSPIDPDHFDSVLSLGIPEATILWDVFVPMGRPGLLRLGYVGRTKIDAVRAGSKREGWRTDAA